MESGGQTREKWSCQADKGQKKHPEEGVKRGRSERYDDDGGGGQGKRPGGGLSERDKLLR